MVSETQPGCSGGIFGVSQLASVMAIQLGSGGDIGVFTEICGGHSVMFDRRLPQVNLLWCVQTSASDTESQTQRGDAVCPENIFSPFPPWPTQAGVQEEASPTE